mmetsp:Transcript_1694/g.4232  ORF Transcript_1694/g.4232 Transcript_1694/m.4232 type:complete len:297 (-) Transcript_1694:1741-2631(-)
MPVLVLFGLVVLLAGALYELGVASRNDCARALERRACSAAALSSCSLAGPAGRQLRMKLREPKLTNSGASAPCPPWHRPCTPAPGTCCTPCTCTPCVSTRGPSCCTTACETGWLEKRDSATAYCRARCSKVPLPCKPPSDDRWLPTPAPRCETPCSVLPFMLLSLLLIPWGLVSWVPLQLLGGPCPFWSARSSLPAAMLPSLLLRLTLLALTLELLLMEDPSRSLTPCPFWRPLLLLLPKLPSTIKAPCASRSSDLPGMRSRRSETAGAPPPLPLSSARSSCAATPAGLRELPADA